MKRFTLACLRQLGVLVLLSLIVGVAHPATAQTSSFDPEAPLESLRTAHASADSQLVRLATGLLEARADTKISFDTYVEGVRYFQRHHPQFYGAFFGDPFYARYNIRYEKLAQERQFANLEINPQNSFWSRQWLLCHPLGYDPAFGGRCWGITYAATDFFRLPTALRLQPFPHQSRKGRTFWGPVIRTISSWSLAVGSPPTQRGPEVGKPGDTPEVPSQSPTHPALPKENPSEKEDGSSATGAVAAIEALPSRIRVPEDRSASMQSRASLFRRIEKKMLIRRLMRKRYGDDDLSARERYEFAKTVAEKLSSGDLTAKGSVSEAAGAVVGASEPVSTDKYRRLLERSWDRSATLTERSGGTVVRRESVGVKPQLDIPDPTVREMGPSGISIENGSREEGSSRTRSSNSENPSGSDGGSGSEDPSSEG
ncbi:MAG: hypothetical protein ABEK84_07470 [Salinibacter sp.]